MLESISLPLCGAVRTEYGGWSGLREELARLGCGGIEAIWAGEDLPADFPPDLLGGYHLTFFPDWLDFYREDKPALLAKYGSMEAVRQFYGGVGAETLLNLYRADLERAAALRARYVVFHVSDVSVDEGYTYQWLHGDREVIDASVEVLNTLLAGRNWPFAVLVENQWWPGFTFTDPDMTARLVEGIRYPDKGILLDTGHLMNTNPALRTQEEGALYLIDMLERHGTLSQAVRGVHLHQSLSGAYVRKHTGFLPQNQPKTPIERFCASYQHILQIDRHRPWTDPAILPVLVRIAPEFLTHELQAGDRAARFQAVRTQRDLLERGGLV